MNKLTNIWKKRRGFTLVELIVVMAVVGILVLLAAPRFLGRTDEANRTKHIANARTIQEASERYFVDEEDWPRLTDDAYGHEDIAEYAEKIFDLTGEEVTLDPDGSYYDIDYDELRTYVSVADADKNNYILQNPVGKVYYLEGVDDILKDDIMTDIVEKRETQGRITYVHEYLGDDEDIVFSGLGPAAFDGNLHTSVDNINHNERRVTWTGNIADRELEVSGLAGWGNGLPYQRYLVAQFRDNQGRVVSPANMNTTGWVTISTNRSTPVTAKLVAPQSATELVIKTSGSTHFSSLGHVNNISVADSKDRPRNIDIATETTSSSVTFDLSPFKRAIIHKNGRLLRDTTADSFKDAPLYAGETQIYDIFVLNEHNNGQHIRYEVGTPVDVVAFRGLGPAAFDGNWNTSVTNIRDTENRITWTGDLAYREIEIAGQAGWGNGLPYQRHLIAQFRDAQDRVVSPININNTGWVTVTTSRTSPASNKLVVPPTATSLIVKTEGASHFSTTAEVHSITAPSVNSRPQNPEIVTEPTNSSVIFDLSAFERTIIRKNGRTLTDTRAASYTDGPLYAGEKQTYEVIVLDNEGNGKHITHEETTGINGVAFRGLAPAAFDGNLNTSVANIRDTENTITWTGDIAGRRIRVAGKAGWGNGLPYQRHLVAQFRDAQGRVVSPQNMQSTGWITVSTSQSSVSSVNLEAPENAESLIIKTSGSSHFSETGEVSSIDVVN